MSGWYFPSDGRSSGKTSHTENTLLRRAEHLEKRVEEIHEGKFDDLIEQIMQKPITDMQELYNNREIEK